MRDIVPLLAVIVALWFGGRGLHAEPPATAEDETTSRATADGTALPDSAENAQLEAAKSHVRRLELRDASGEQIEIIDHPLLRYSDPARVNSNGTVWAWGKTGRPVAFLELFQASKTDKNWVQSVTLTSPQKVTLTIPGGRWQPAQAQFEPHVVPDAPTPGDRPSTRLRQIKDIARRFTAHEFWDPDNSRFELRLLVQPVHRYSDQEAGIQDGAAFIIAHGTNPEAVLLIEALGASLNEARWHYALARSSHAETHVELDGQEVWKSDRFNATNEGPTRNYWLFLSALETTAND
jgi:hypothetical protein